MAKKDDGDDDNSSRDVSISSKSDNNNEQDDIVDDNSLVKVSLSSLFIAITPLGLISIICWWIGLVDISFSVVSGCFRTFLQLTLLGTILRPIFLMKNLWLVILYAIFMVILAALESSSRTKYQFDGQFICILFSLAINVLWVSLLAFVCILRPKPIWNPRYMIPIVGMLLGNSISAVSLSMNTITTSFVERQSEIELYLSFGASHYEAVSRLVLDGISVGATPVMNMMRVTGIISIPGMMTGQLLGGSSAMVAARYQMLIIYLIAMCTLGVILLNAWMVIMVGFDSHEVLRTDLFSKNKSLGSVAMIMWLLGTVGSTLGNSGLQSGLVIAANNNNLTDSSNHLVVLPPKGALEIRTLKESCPSISTKDRRLKVSKISRSFLQQGPDTSSDNNVYERRTVFTNVSFEVSPGDMLLINGPSGVGKSSLLKTIAGLGSLDEGTMQFVGRPWDVVGGHNWRKQIRYVSQSKVDIPGTPKDFLSRVTKFASWRKDNMINKEDDENIASRDSMLQRTQMYLDKWGIESNCLDKEWSMLSGGESQRVIVALAMASRPTILLLDETSSGLELATKIVVEESVKEFVYSHSGGVIWVSHDSQQAERMSNFERRE